MRYIATVKPFCKAAHPVCIDDADRFTEPTGQKIDANNRGLKALEGPGKDQCPPTPSCKAKQ